MAKRKNNERASYEVWLDAPELGENGRVGHLHHSLTQSDLPPSFAYDGDWLASTSRFMLDPRLELWQGEQYPQSGQPNFGIMMDSAPDRWGRVLLERREAAQAEREQRPMRALQEIDFLLGIHDFTRMGALRFRQAASAPYLANHPLPAPPVTRLTELAYISARIEEPGVEKLPEYEKWLSMLIAPGSSLGGARPKANFTDSDDSLWFAKFPAHDDRFDIGGWEYLSHTLAARAGVVVPTARRVALGGRYQTFCVQRFDRAGGTRRMFASAMTLLEQQDGASTAGYPDLAQFIADAGQQNRINADLAQLFRRVLFNVLIGNRDDHLRNHGFIRGKTGWMLSPAYDMNPNPNRASHILTLDGYRTEPDVARVLATSEWYRLGKAAANQVLDEVRAALKDWRTLAEQQGLSTLEIGRMASVIQA
jgi:serine/threonine-protein kinase HipA